MSTKLLMPAEADRILRYPRGRSVRLAREGKIPAVFLPDGEVRFRQETIESMIEPATAKPAGGSHV